ncbi:hypothetical protein [Cytobacillus purgationiresistens]|uniref:Membrane protease YdiL (CAAX protease family) n=1 Tax=Cytobacillus purgationiresistens TaxID=863449 RepID=A0ABU0AI76_9BACI|nr:hypothetical protein [Cytobacillus purgationiresistens]MDQ0270955.1 membrane protease YdiL (CAAX protease family) [Cytobacillus purgationiresistens]
MIARIVVVLIFAIIFWRIVGILNHVYIGEAYSRTIHFFIAVFLTLLNLILVGIALRVDKIEWKQLGFSTLRSNLFSFFVGLVSWIILALIGIVVCLKLGWVEITLLSSLNYLMLSILILFITVFLIEALP